VTAAFLIAAKDLRLRMRDRSAFVLGILAPLGLALIFGQILPDFGGGEFVIDVAVVDDDGSDVSSGFATTLSAVESTGLVDVRSVDDAGEARRLVDEGELDVAYVIPPGFGDAATMGRPASMSVIGNADGQTATLIAASIARSYADRITATQVAVATAIAQGVTDVPGVVSSAMEAPDPVTIADITAESKVLDSATYLAAGMAVFFLFFTVSFGVSSLIAERTDGTLPRLLAAPIGPGAIIAGKAIAAFVVGVVSMVVLALGTTVTVGAHWGNPFGVLLLVLAGVAAALGIMALVATMAKTPEQAANWQSVVAVVLGLLGGTFFPIEQGPDALATVSLLTPHAWFLRGVADNAAAAGLAELAGPLAGMLAFALVATGLAATRLRRMVEA
jgi:ABC-2 type transport system permease protein